MHLGIMMLCFLTYGQGLADRQGVIFQKGWTLGCFSFPGQLCPSLFSEYQIVKVECHRPMIYTWCTLIILVHVQMVQTH